MIFLVVAAGGALGAVARFAAAGWVQQATGGSLPFGTLAVNVSGSLALGFLLVVMQAAATSHEARSFVAIGFLGSFTTFSTFSYEALVLAQEGAWLHAGLYALGSVVLGLAAAGLGVAAGMLLTQQAGAS